MKKTLIIFGLLIILVGCGVTPLYINTTLPIDIQQNIKTSQTKDIDIEFVPAPNGHVIEVKPGPMWNAKFAINKPFNDLLYELLLTKFSNVTENSDIKLLVEIKDIESNYQRGGLDISTNGNYRIKMVVNVKLFKKDKVINSRRISYSASMVLQAGTESANAIFKQQLKDLIDNFLAKFIIGIDKFIDSNRI